KRIVVTTDPMPQTPEAQTEFVNSLAQACSRAAELSIPEIELRYNGSRTEQPLEISNTRLTLRAAPGFHPVVLFQPAVSMEHDEMIRLVGGSSAHITFEGLELRLNLPANLPQNGWSLLSMGTGQSLDLTECVLTVADGSANTPPIHDHVTMIAVNRRRAGEIMTMADSQIAMGQQARINLDRLLFPGEDALIRP